MTKIEALLLKMTYLIPSPVRRGRAMLLAGFGIEGVTTKRRSHVGANDYSPLQRHHSLSRLRESESVGARHAVPLLRWREQEIMGDKYMVPLINGRINRVRHVLL